METGQIDIEWVDTHTAILFFNNPSARNAISFSMMSQLENILERLREKKPRTVILTGKGSVSFCAGGDLKDVRQSLGDKEMAREMHTKMCHFFQELNQMPVLIIIALNGVAIGGGAEICSYGHIVFAHEGVMIRFIHNQLALFPGWGAATQLVQKIGIYKARQVLIEAKKLSASEAKGLGLIDYIVEREEVLSKAMYLANSIASRDEDAVRSLLAFFIQPSSQRECAVFLSLWGESAHKEALGIK